MDRFQHLLQLGNMRQGGGGGASDTPAVDTAEKVSDWRVVMRV